MTTSMTNVTCRQPADDKDGTATADENALPASAPVVNFLPEIKAVVVTMPTSQPATCSVDSRPDENDAKGITSNILEVLLSFIYLNPCNWSL